MKAWIGYLEFGDEDYDDDCIVFADDYETALDEATKKIYLEDYQSIIIKRKPEYDGMENLPEDDLAVAQWHRGWEYSDFPELNVSDDLITDDEFKFIYTHAFSQKQYAYDHEYGFAITLKAVNGLDYPVESTHNFDQALMPVSNDKIIDTILSLAATGADPRFSFQLVNASKNQSLGYAHVWPAHLLYAFDDVLLSELLGVSFVSDLKEALRICSKFCVNYGN